MGGNISFVLLLSAILTKSSILKVSLTTESVLVVLFDTFLVSMLMSCLISTLLCIITLFVNETDVSKLFLLVLVSSCLTLLLVTSSVVTLSSRSLPTILLILVTSLVSVDILVVSYSLTTPDSSLEDLKQFFLLTISINLFNSNSMII